MELSAGLGVPLYLLVVEILLVPKSAAAFNLHWQTTIMRL